MALWRCSNPKCSDSDSGVPQHDFEGPVPVCDRCGADGRVPKFRRFISRRHLIHFDPPHETFAGMGLNHAVCDPAIAAGKMKRFEQLTGAPEAVNCPACRAHKDFPVDVDDEYMVRRVPPWTVGAEIAAQEKPRIPLGQPQK